MATRKYQQRLRADAAEDTRRRILDAVYRRLCEAPTETVSIEQVAAMAEVSRSTVYLVFGTRAGLFDALGNDLRGRGGFDRFADAEGNPDAREGLRDSIRAAATVFAAHRQVLRALYSMAQLDAASVGGAVERMGEARAAGLAWHVRRLDEQHALRPGISTADAAHLLWAVTGFEFFDQIYTGRGLSAERAADLMVATAERAVLSAGEWSHGTGCCPVAIRPKEFSAGLPRFQ